MTPHEADRARLDLRLREAQNHGAMSSLLRFMLARALAGEPIPEGTRRRAADAIADYDALQDRRDALIRRAA